MELELKFIDQRLDGLEAWVRKGQSDWIRLDFMLEYYLFANVDLTKRYREKLDDKHQAQQYYELLYDKFIKSTSYGEKFNFAEYINWQRNTGSDIEIARKMLQSD